MNRTTQFLDPSIKKNIIKELSELSREMNSTEGPLSGVIKSKIDHKIEYFRKWMSGDIPSDSGQILMETETMELLVEVAIRNCRSSLSDTSSDRIRERCSRISRTVRHIAGQVS
ncbi:hypothetical protein L2W58_03975 [Dethiosulfovibrio sp. F2B]|uniref:hypothetical protein n=1 Tax=Dethiosulfovibrio faecalis TaxID=2720018 RepID=UPI001F440E35|nr:hypothetical protein [Dethiosulfovibrio faecalis]MCF4150951.1 hypothetical protein [Dethiosulfovibrio faecalis]